MLRFVSLAGAGAALLTMLSTGVLAAPAQAATAGVATVVESTKVRYKAAKGKQNRVVVTRSGNTITVDDKVAVKAGKGCRAVKGDKTRVRCTTKKAPTRIRVYTFDRNDSVVNRTGLGMTADGGTGADTLTGGPRSDTLRGGSGADKLYGLGGTDWMTGSDGNDRLDGGDGDDSLDGGFGNDTLVGRNGHDQLLGMDGNDKEYGGAGPDTFDQAYDPSLPDADLFAGGSGEDTVTYISRARAVIADNDGAKGDDGAKNEHDSIGTDVENIDGGDGNDRLTGNSARNVLRGLGGNDTLIGGGGDDALDGGTGKDHLNGGAGDDSLFGDDSFGGARAADVLLGGAGRDRVSYLGYTKAVTVDLDGVAGDDGQSGEHDTVGADVEDIHGGAGNDRLTGNAGNNLIYGLEGDDIVRGGAGNDELEGDDGRDQLYGEAGDDSMTGADGYRYDVPDRLDGGANTAIGDICQPLDNDVTVDCERDRP